MATPDTKYSYKCAHTWPRISRKVQQHTHTQKGGHKKWENSWKYILNVSSFWHTFTTLNAKWENFSPLHNEPNKKDTHMWTCLQTEQRWDSSREREWESEQWQWQKWMAKTKKKTKWRISFQQWISRCTHWIFSRTMVSEYGVFRFRIYTTHTFHY